MASSKKKLWGLSVVVMLFLTLCVFQANAAVITSGVWKYETNSTGITVVGTTQAFTNSGSALVIPSTIDGYYVTEIKSSAFCNGGFYGISIPDSVKTIGNGAFSGCQNISSVTIPQGVTSLGYGVFSNCNRLSSVTILGNPSLSSGALGSNSKTVRTYRTSSKVISFCNTYSSFLTVVYLDSTPTNTDTNPTVFTYTDSYGTWTFDRTTSTITKYTGTASWVTVPENIKYGGKNYKVKTLGEKAILNNNSITWLILNTPNVSKYAVYGCNNLKTIELNMNVVFLDTYCFWYNQNVTSFKVAGNPITTHSVIYPNSGLYVNCSNLSLYIRYYCYNNHIRDNFSDINLAQDIYQYNAFYATNMHGYGGLSDTIYFVIVAAVGYDKQWEFWTTGEVSNKPEHKGDLVGLGTTVKQSISAGDKYLAKMLYNIWKGWIKEKYPSTYQNYYTPDYVYFNASGTNERWWA